MKQWWFVYILKCSDGKPYVGYTSNLKARLQRHQNGDVKFTAKRRPLVLSCCTAFPNKYQALAFEKYLKSGSGRAFAKRHYLRPSNS
ncbi:MAG: GIY-YIG nuclease family protein [Saprospirales bacterium]|nr:GIY-YIG nuclease family protein [Saprospirales bacterium]MBK8492035.1 GIY-YIG nuclease family protein [Saprospirales bacterium]